MDKYAKQLNDYLELMSRSTLLVDEGDRRNMKVLLTMLGPIDEQSPCACSGKACLSTT